MLPKLNTLDIDKVVIAPKKEYSINGNYEETVKDADMVLLGTGIYPNTEIFDQVVCMNDNYINCDGYMSTSDSDIFAAGDICFYPYKGIRIISGHFNQAHQQGVIAALNMLNKNVLYEYPPYVFSISFFDSNLYYVGISQQFDEIITDGSLDKLNLKAYYIFENKLVAFASINSPNSHNVIYEILKNNLNVSGNMIKSGQMKVDKLEKILKRMKARFFKLDSITTKQIEGN